MSDVNEAVTLDQPVDPGCLPAWDVGDLPDTQPFRAKNYLKLLGPGLVLAGGSIGTGEWVMGPQAAAKYHGAMMWAVLLSIIAQVVLNTEVMRYTLCTGEPIMTGFLRTKPGPRFWLIAYLLLDFSALWPALAGLAAQIVVVAVYNLSPTASIDPAIVQKFSYVIFGLCGLMVLFGGKVYNAVSAVMTGKVMFLLIYMTFCCVFFVSLKTWGQIWGGLFNPFMVPRNAAGAAEIDWSLISALAGFAGVGGMGNIMVSNFVREKGWGMGAQVGAIPSAVGGEHITLSHVGMICRDTPDNHARFKNWFSRVAADQYLVWALASLVGMMLPCLLGAEYLNAKSLHATEQWKWAAAMAQDFGAAKGHIFTILTLLCGLTIMVPGQFYSVDNVARRWTDNLWSGSRRIRKWPRTRIKGLYYFFAGLYVLWGMTAYTLFPSMSASTMMKLSGNLANLIILVTIFHTLYVNTRFLPKALQPSRAKQVALVLSGLFFAVMFALVVNERILPMFFGSK